MRHCQAPHPWRNGSGGFASRGLEVSFPTLLQCLASPVTWQFFTWGCTLSLSQRAPVLEPSGLFSATWQDCALLRGDLVSLFHFLRTFLPHVFSPAGWGPPCLLLTPPICLLYLLEPKSSLNQNLLCHGHKISQGDILLSRTPFNLFISWHKHV